MNQPLSQSHPNTLGRIYREQRESLIRIATRILRDPDRAQDAVHQVFSRLGADFHTRIAQGSQAHYLARAVRREGLYMQRSAARHVPIDTVNIPVQLAQPMTIHELLKRNGRSIAVRECIDKLADGQREALILQVYHGLSYAEIAAHLGISRRAVEKRLAAARAKLKTQLMRRGFGSETCTVRNPDGGVEGLVHLS